MRAVGREGPSDSGLDWIRRGRSPIRGFVEIHQLQVAVIRGFSGGDRIGDPLPSIKKAALQKIGSNEGPDAMDKRRADACPATAIGEHARTLARVEIDFLQ